MARFEMADGEIGALGEATLSADVFYDLGMKYAVGQGAPSDFVAAHKWFNIAALRGNKEAVLKRREIAEQMTDSEIGLAQRAARDWLKSHQPVQAPAVRQAA